MFTYVIEVNFPMCVSNDFLLEKIPLLECDPRIVENEASLTVPSELEVKIDFGCEKSELK